MTKEEILGLQIGGHPSKTMDLAQIDTCYDAMDEYAKQEAIGFAEWIRISAVSGNDGTWHYQTSKHLYDCVNESELYTHYKNQNGK